MKKHERDVIREWTRLPGFKLDGPVLERLLDGYDELDDSACQMAAWLDATRHAHGDSGLSVEIGKLLVSSRAFDLLPTAGATSASVESQAATGA